MSQQWWPAGATIELDPGRVHAAVADRTNAENPSCRIRFPNCLVLALSCIAESIAHMCYVQLGVRPSQCPENTKKKHSDFNVQYTPAGTIWR
jgi:hypothetical protein